MDHKSKTNLVAMSSRLLTATLIIIVVIFQVGCQKKVDKTSLKSVMGGFISAIVANNPNEATGYWQFKDRYSKVRYHHQIGLWAKNVDQAKVNKVLFVGDYYDFSTYVKFHIRESEATSAIANVTLYQNDGKTIKDNLFGLRKFGKKWAITDFVRIKGGWDENFENISIGRASECIDAVTRFLNLVKEKRLRTAYSFITDSEMLGSGSKVPRERKRKVSYQQFEKKIQEFGEFGTFEAFGIDSPTEPFGDGVEVDIYFYGKKLPKRMIYLYCLDSPLGGVWTFPYYYDGSRFRINFEGFLEPE